MKSKFEVVGIIIMAPSKRSLRIELNDLPFTTFKHNAYVSIKDVEEVIRGKKQTATTINIKDNQQ